MALSKFFRRFGGVRAATTTNDQEKNAPSPFLELPGEIRNQIYFYAMYPDLPSLTIVNCSQYEHFGGTVLHLPLFRTCRQIRMETLSYICSTKNIKVLGIETANAFFELIGATIGNLKSMTLVQPTREITPLYREQEDRFFAFMKEATALRKFQLAEVGKMIMREEGEAHWAFARALVKRVEGLGEGGKVVVQLHFG